MLVGYNVLGLQGEQSTWAKLSAIKSNCGIEVCLDKCLRELEHQSRLAREDEAKKRREAGLAPSKIAEEGAAATGDSEGAAQSSLQCPQLYVISCIAACLVQYLLSTLTGPCLFLVCCILCL